MSFVKDKRDLNAQEGMWRAANYLVALTFGELVFGVAALIFLGWTLMETRKTADAAVKTAEAAEAAERAYVSVDFELRHVGPENIERSVIEVVAHVTNYGKAPASDINWTIGYTKAPQGAKTETVNRIFQDPRPPYGAGGRGHIPMLGTGRDQRVLCTPLHLTQADIIHSQTFPHYRAIWSGDDVLGGEFSGEVDVHVDFGAGDKFYSWIQYHTTEHGHVPDSEKGTMLKYVHTLGIKVLERRNSKCKETYKDKNFA